MQPTETYELMRDNVRRQFTIDRVPNQQFALMVGGLVHRVLQWPLFRMAVLLDDRWEDTSISERGVSAEDTMHKLALKYKILTSPMGPSEKFRETHNLLIKALNESHAIKGQLYRARQMVEAGLLPVDPVTEAMLELEKVERIDALEKEVAVLKTKIDRNTIPLETPWTEENK